MTTEGEGRALECGHVVVGDTLPPQRLMALAGDGPLMVLLTLPLQLVEAGHQLCVHELRVVFVG